MTRPRLGFISVSTPTYLTDERGPRPRDEDKVRWALTQLMRTSEIVTRYEHTLREHLERASIFLTQRQLIEPWVTHGKLYGCVSPWELGTWIGAYEDFHDTLEAIWIWTVYTYVVECDTFSRNIRAAIRYVLSNYDRFLKKENSGFIYDASHLMHTSHALESLL